MKQLLVILIIGFFALTISSAQTPNALNRNTSTKIEVKTNKVEVKVNSGNVVNTNKIDKKHPKKHKQHGKQSKK